jgi:threonine aldolase
MLYALDHHVERLAEDHARAARLAEALRHHDRLELSPVETNIVYFRCRRGKAAELAAELRENGVLVSQVGAQQLRACTHLGVGDAAIERAIQVFSVVLSR